MKKIKGLKINCRDCTICFNLGKTYWQMMKKGENELYFCTGCRNIRSDKQLDILAKELMQDNRKTQFI